MFNESLSDNNGSSKFFKKLADILAGSDTTENQNLAAHYSIRAILKTIGDGKKSKTDGDSLEMQMATACEKYVNTPGFCERAAELLASSPLTNTINPDTITIYLSY